MERRGWGGALEGVGVLLTSGTLAGLTDGDLIARLADRRSAESAFEAIVDRHGPMVRRVCLGILRHEHDADDAFQAVLLVLARRAGSLRDPDALGPWLHGVALRTARLARRRRRDGAEAPGVVAVEAPPDRDVLRREEAGVLHEEIARLGEDQRVAVVLCHLQGLTHEEAGRRLGIPSGTVGVRLSRARDRLRSRLARRGFGPTSATIPPARSRDEAHPPASVALAIIRGAASGEVPAGVASLAAGVLRAMVFSIPLKVSAAIAGLGLVAAVSASIAWSAAGPPPRIAAPRPRPRAPLPAPVDGPIDLFRKAYRLAPGEVVKRVAPPFAPWRAVDAEARFPFLEENRERRGTLTTLIYREREGVLANPSMTFGAANDPGRWLLYLLDDVAGFPAQDVAGPDELLKTPIAADWIVAADADRDRRLAAFGAILRDECRLPIRLVLREIEGEVVVARGRYTPRPMSPGKDDIELYGATLTPDGGGGGGTGDLGEFLVDLGRFVEPHRRVVDEVEGRPAGAISWHRNYRSPFSEPSTREDRGDEAVLKHVAEQTGLTFAVERRKRSIVAVEGIPD